MTIRTKDDWWKLFDQIKGDFETLFSNAGVPELLPQLNEAAQSRDGKKAQELLNKCWFAAPDSPVIHSWPNWGNLCDLCSEAWVFYEDEENADAEAVS